MGKACRPAIALLIGQVQVIEMEKDAGAAGDLFGQVIRVAPYSVLADIYDRMMAHVNYKRWAFYLEAIFRREGIRAGNLLDIGCGTGKLVWELHRRGWSVAGCDPSPEMIAVAQKSYPRLHFTV
ncbi:MAG: class I SAM-dependent methyltransferase, partial [Calditrichaeota bacterium]